MTYKKTLDWLYQRLPSYQKIGHAALNYKLYNIEKFLEYLDNPETKSKSIHIAGTNGKGSSAHMTASILQQAGYKVGLYTSPHLKDFRERIKINGKEVSEDFVIDFVSRNKSFLEDNKLSFFEVTVGMAFKAFSKNKVDIAVVETGLGGRLDSTNVISPEICLITNIGYDHMGILGNSLESIALEKTGIIKPNTTIVVSERQEALVPLFKKAALEKNAPLYWGESKIFFETDLKGIYQKKNIKGVVTLIKHLKGFKIKPSDIKEGLKNVVVNTGIKGRWQKINSHPKTIVDTAHNLSAFTEVLNQISEEKAKKKHFVLGFIKDKDIEPIVDILPKDGIYYLCQPLLERALNTDTLLKLTNKKELDAIAYSSVKEAFKQANKKASTEDFIFIGGSTFVVAEVL